MPATLRDIVDLICLCYHEARNVRYPAKAGKLAEPSKYKSLINLPVNREDAWRALGDLRSRAAASGSVREAARAFEKAFGLSLADLHALYAMPVWKHSAYGGNKWAQISANVCEFIASAPDGNLPDDEEFRTILSMSHNTGRVSEKLERLNAACAGP